MGRIPRVQIKQPHVEQLHKFVEQALSEVHLLHIDLASTGCHENQVRVEEIDYLLKTIEQNLPPKQLKLDL